MPGIVSQLLADSGDGNPLAPKQPHFPAKAKRVIFIFCNGGVSHMDTFDPKPELFDADGKMTGVGGGLSNQQTRAAQAAVGFQAGRQVRHAGQRSVSAPSRADGRHLPDSLDEVATTTSTTRRRWPCTPARSSSRGRALALGELWPGHDQPESAVVHR